MSPMFHTVTPVLFLDFDGVITTAKTRYRTFDDDCMKLLQNIIYTTEADIVVSSSWRIGKSTAELRDLFKPWNLDWAVIDKTPVLSVGDFIRGTEINQWISKNPTQKFAILDDDSDMEPLTHRWIQTDINTGLTKETANLTIDMLRREP